MADDVMPIEPPRVHGGLIDEELAGLQLRPADVLDFSVSTNPYGPCDAVLRAARDADIARYPDPFASACLHALAGSLDRSPQELLLGGGAADLLWSAARTWLASSARVLIVEPTFGELRAAAQAVGAYVCEWRARRADGFAIELEAVATSARKQRADMIYLCAPNTPTGCCLPAISIADWAQALPNITIVLDQSFLALSERFDDARVRMPANVVTIRSLTKEHSIAGIRAGYALATRERIAALQRQRPAWSTSAPTQAAVIAACAQVTFVASSRERMLQDRARMEHELRDLGLWVAPSASTFLLVEVGSASALRARLLARHRILVRDCSSFQLPDFIRVGARPAGESARLCSALREELVP